MVRLLIAGQEVHGEVVRGRCSRSTPHGVAAVGAPARKARHAQVAG